MTHTFDTKSYTDLLVRYQPKPIFTEVENDAAIALAQELEHRSTRSPEEELFLELLVTLIEKFEAEHYAISKGTPGSMLQHLMDARELEPSNLVPILGTEALVSEVLANQRAIDLNEAKRLAEFFQVDVSLFLESEL